VGLAGLHDLRGEKINYDQFWFSTGVYKLVYCIVQENPRTLHHQNTIQRLADKYWITVKQVLVDMRRREWVAVEL
jgi:hypothetical protein